MVDANELIAEPTYYEHVRHFFEQQDIDCMLEVRNFNLGNFNSLKAVATSVYQHVKSGHMPPQAERRWSPNRVKTFKNWITGKYRFGTIPMNGAEFSRRIGDQNVPLRRDVDSLSETEKAQLKKAFEGLMAREPSDPASYFALAGIHWFPEPAYCVHHELKYNPWHRVYIDRFEAALRTVPGCENITLPYWDIIKRPPDWLFEPPFNSYRLQADATDAYPAGTATEHYSPDEIAVNVAAADIPATIRAALNDRTFEGFASSIERAHDNGHGACGPSMSSTDIASFDPLFWFFHCNWERLWWAWQVRFDAGTLTGFLAAFDDLANSDWLEEGFDDLPGFEALAGETIAIDRYRYESGSVELMGDVTGDTKGSAAAFSTFELAPSAILSVRIKGINRLRINGSFRTRLMADDEEVAQSFFFQSTKPEKCANCAKRPLVDVDFKVAREKLGNRKLRVEITRETPTGEREILDIETLGTPTINVRQLLRSE